EAVLQRYHESVRREVLLDQRRRPFGVIGLHRHEGDVDRLLARQPLHLGEVHGLGILDRDLLLRRHAVEGKTLAPDGLAVLRPEADQGDVLAGMGEPAADISAQRSNSDDCNPLAHFPSSLMFAPLPVSSRAQRGTFSHYRESSLAALGMTRA